MRATLPIQLPTPNRAWTKIATVWTNHLAGSFSWKSIKTTSNTMRIILLRDLCGIHEWIRKLDGHTIPLWNNKGFNKQGILHYFCLAQAVCITVPSEFHVKTEMPIIRLHTGQIVLVVFSKTVLRVFIYSSLTSNLLTSANLRIINIFLLFSSNFVITVSILSDI